MGIRIHKQMGYGLTDVKSGDGHSIDDPRVNPEGIFCDHESDFSCDDYLKFLKKDMKRKDVDTFHDIMEFGQLKLVKKQKKHSDVRSCFVYDGEMALDNVLLITPISMLDQWRHYDDAIDYAEETLKYDSGDINYFTIINTGFYPWNYQFWDKRTYKMMPSGMLDFQKQKQYMPADDLEIMAQRYGFESWAEFEENCVPAVPEAVRLISTFGKAFNDPEMWRQLKPMIYVWWS